MRVSLTVSVAGDHCGTSPSPIDSRNLEPRRTISHRFRNPTPPNDSGSATTCSATRTLTETRPSLSRCGLLRSPKGTLDAPAPLPAPQTARWWPQSSRGRPHRQVRKTGGRGKRKRRNRRTRRRVDASGRVRRSGRQCCSSCGSTLRPRQCAC